MVNFTSPKWALILLICMLRERESIITLPEVGVLLFSLVKYFKIPIGNFKYIKALKKLGLVLI